MKKYLLSGVLILGLGACGQSGAPGGAASSAQTPEKQVLGFVQMTFTNESGKMRLSTQSVEPNGVGGFRAQSLTQPSGITITATSDRGSASDGNGHYMYGTFNVSNSGAPVQNLALVAFNIEGYSLYDTSLTNVTRSDGQTVTTQDAHYMWPINARKDNLDKAGLPLDPSIKIIDEKADYVAYHESDITGITAFLTKRFGSSGKKVSAFPFGFAARSNDGTHTIAKGTNTGQVTLAFADMTPYIIPIRTFTFIGVITADVGYNPANLADSNAFKVGVDVLEEDKDRACHLAEQLKANTVTYFVGVYNNSNIPACLGGANHPHDYPIYQTRYAGYTPGPDNRFLDSSTTDKNIDSSFLNAAIYGD